MENGGNMYNKEIKERYLSLLQSDYKILHSLFKNTKKFEEAMERDLFDIPIEETLKYLLEGGNIASIQYLKSTASRIRSYKMWALVENLIDEKYKFIEPRLKLRQLFNEYNNVNLYRTPKDLKDMTDKYLYNRSEKGVTSDEILTAYFMLIYQGFRKDEVLELTLDNILFTNNYIVVKNNRIATVIYKEFYSTIAKIYNNRTYAKVSIADDNAVAMNEYFISLGDDFDQKKVQVKLSKTRNRRISTTERFNINELYLMGCIYEGKISNCSFEEVYDKSKEGMEHGSSTLKENLKVMWENW